MPELITQHVWRPRAHRPATSQCEYMNCRRPREEHARSVTRCVL
jgi:hypothetical protein